MSKGAKFNQNVSKRLEVGTELVRKSKKR